MLEVVILEMEVCYQLFWVDRLYVIGLLAYLTQEINSSLAKQTLNGGSANLD